MKKSILFLGLLLYSNITLSGGDGSTSYFWNVEKSDVRMLIYQHNKVLCSQDNSICISYKNRNKFKTALTKPNIEAICNNSSCSYYYSESSSDSAIPVLGTSNTHIKRLKRRKIPYIHPTFLWGESFVSVSKSNDYLILKGAIQTARICKNTIFSGY